MLQSNRLLIPPASLVISSVSSFLKRAIAFTMPTSVSESLALSLMEIFQNSFHTGKRAAQIQQDPYNVAMVERISRTFLSVS